MIATRRTSAATPRSRGRPGDRGVTVVELAFLTPILLTLVLLIVQYAMWFHAKQVALAAAREGARVARQLGSHPTVDWRQAATGGASGVLNQIGPHLLRQVNYVPIGDGTHIRGVTVTGQAWSVLPFPIDLTVTETVEAPVECFRPDVLTAQDCAP